MKGKLTGYAEVNPKMGKMVKFKQTMTRYKSNEIHISMICMKDFNIVVIFY